jgi:hypothetical protein
VFKKQASLKREEIFAKAPNCYYSYKKIPISAIQFIHGNK